MPAISCVTIKPLLEYEPYLDRGDAWLASLIAQLTAAQPNLSTPEVETFGVGKELVRSLSYDPSTRECKAEGLLWI